MRKLLTLLLLTSGTFLFAQNRVSLSGQWSVKLDSLSEGVIKGYNIATFDTKVNLPASLDELGLGEKSVGSDFGILTRKYKYYGKAWYNREIDIPKQWEGRDVIFDIDRAMWSTTVFVDGMNVGEQHSLGTPHVHNLGKLKAGKHLLSVCVDNDMIYNIGDKGHAYSEYTQTIWNGMVGSLMLYPKEAICDLEVWADYESRSVELKFDMLLKDVKYKNGELIYKIIDNSTDEVVFSDREKILLDRDTINHSFKIVLSSKVKCWSEFNPNLYSVDVELCSFNRKGSSLIEESSVKQTFGFRKVSSNGHKVTLNGESVFIRGNLDCVHFPLTGYPSCDVGEWERIFNIYKSHGLNKVRFHSWCPPRAAFEAADKLGIYIQAEVLWIDYWMALIQEDRPEMYTKGLPKGLGENSSANEYVKEELRAMLKAYGNHPSFVFMCIGNELGNSDFEVMQTWIDSLRLADNRRIYSVSTARQIRETDEFMATHNIPGVGGTYDLGVGKGTTFNLENNYSKISIPIFAHELGQYPIYPLWSEIDKYKGVVEARNLQEFQLEARKNGVEKMNEKFQQSSGKLQNLLYKTHIENLVRTPSCAGFHLLSMTDYAGQGEALIGWLDSFWDSKEVISAEEFRQYSSEVVPLLNFKKYVWKANEKFEADVQIANYSFEDMNSVVVLSVENERGKLLYEQTFDAKLAKGGLTNVSKVTYDFDVVKAQKLTIKLTLKDTPYKNSWNIWVYPSVNVEYGDVKVFDRVDSKTLGALENGDKVLLLADKLGSESGTTPIFFTPLFWSNTFFPGQAVKTLGLYVDNSHAALSDFPSDSYSGWQWQQISSGRSFILNNHQNITPITQPITDFHINDKLGSIFEVKVGNGQMLVCGYDLSGDREVSTQLLFSLLNYMNSDKFVPSESLGVEVVKDMFVFEPKSEMKAPEGFENSVLYVECGANVKDDKLVDWVIGGDNVQKADKQIDFTVKGIKLAPQQWVGDDVELVLNVAKGVIGELYIEISATADVTIEGRKYSVKSNKSTPTWLKLFVMREDTGDGEVKVVIKTTDENVAKISKLALELRN